MGQISFELALAAAALSGNAKDTFDVKSCVLEDAKVS
jgi:hypothetical protein